VGTALRSHPRLCKVPLMALTAAAAPRTQQDILKTLQMHDNAFVSKKTFDRSNLAIRVLPKESCWAGAVRSTMEPLIRKLLMEEQASKVAATIIYASTRAQVEEIASFLQQRLQASYSEVQVDYYHGGVCPRERHATHLAFLTGRTAVVVATTAFGMGIDKPDTRRVIHLGPPQTVEEYYHQIGRAGRDGLPAECTLYVAPTDFDKYYSDYYLGNLKNLRAREATIRSTTALKQFAMDKETCRRKALLEFFGEVPTFGERCGTCDVCLAKLHDEKSSQKEVELGDDKVIQAYLTWNRRVESLRKNEKHEQASHLVQLLQLMVEWRSDVARKLQIAPVSVMTDYMMYTVAYTAQSFPDGLKMTASLQLEGIRRWAIQSLANVIASWQDRYQQLATSDWTFASNDPVFENQPISSKTTRNGKNWCSRCGRDSHSVKDCFARTNVNGQVLEASDSSFSDQPACYRGRCSRCGRDSHSVKDCFARTNVNGQDLESSDSSFSDEDACYRCGRSSHFASNCYARTDINGYFL
jgi:Helicase conserved C-terminal domain/RecQ zinc-binding/GAG-polyprotein viral zinc-finger